MSLASLRIALAAHGDSSSAGLLTRAPNPSVNEDSCHFLLCPGLSAFPRFWELGQRGGLQREGQNKSGPEVGPFGRIPAPLGIGKGDSTSGLPGLIELRA